jgi:hypothetical protein
MGIKTHKYFLPHARLNRGQRRYCHCLMKARTTKTGRTLYGFCRTIAPKPKANNNLVANNKTKKSKKTKQSNKTKQNSQYVFNPLKTNCVMSYDYNDYSITEVRALCKEKGIAIRDPKTGSYWPRDRLVQMLTTAFVKRTLPSISNAPPKKQDKDR